MARIEILRRADDDLPGVVRVLRRVHERDGYPARWPADPAGWLTPAAAVDAWVAIANGVLVGHALLELGPPGEGHVGRLFTAVDSRGAGVGVRLLDTVVAAARARDLRPVLTVDTAAQRPIGLYERAGWVRTDTYPANWTRGDGSPVELHRYVLL